MRKNFINDFIDEKFLQDALQHSSIDSNKNYERLEFLGDAILTQELHKILLTKQISRQEINSYQQKYLSKKHLSDCAKLLQIKPAINLSHMSNKISDRIYCNLIESLVAAIYLHGRGISEFCKRFIFQRIFDTEIKQCYKITLQNYMMQNKLPKPIYISHSLHDIFKCYCIAVIRKSKSQSDIIIKSIESRTKKEGEKALAKHIVDQLGI